MFFKLPHILRVESILFVVVNGQFVPVQVQDWLTLAKFELKEQVTAISDLDPMIVAANFEHNTIRPQLGVVKEAASGWAVQNRKDNLLCELVLMDDALVIFYLFNLLVQTVNYLLSHVIR